MFGLGGGLDPKKMQAMMKQLGIKTEQIEASKVIIEKVDGGKIVIEEPNIQKMIMQGQETWQIMGTAREEAEGIREEDIEIVVEKAKVSKQEAKKALEESGGDIAEAIMKLSDIR